MSEAQISVFVGGPRDGDPIEIDPHWEQIILPNPPKPTVEPFPATGRIDWDLTTSVYRRVVVCCRLSDGVRRWYTATWFLYVYKHMTAEQAIAAVLNGRALLSDESDWLLALREYSERPHNQA